MTRESAIDQVDTCVREFRFRVLTKKTFPAKQEDFFCLSFDLRILITPFGIFKLFLSQSMSKYSFSTTTDTV